MTARPYVLVVEDEAIIALDLCEDLKERGFEVTIAMDENAAMKAISERLPDLAFLDYHLRVETTVAIAGLLRVRNVPFIVCSGSLAEDNAIFAGAPLLAKPFGTDSITATLKAVPTFAVLP